MSALRKMSARVQSRELTATEASVVLGMPKTQVNNLVDEVAQAGGARRGGGHRSVRKDDLFVILLAKELTQYQLKPALRQKAIKTALRSSSDRVDVPSTNLSVMVKPYRIKAEEGFATLEAAEASVSCDPEILQGEPCIAGTRVPVHTLAAIAKKNGNDAAQKTYSFLTVEQVQLAVLYAKANPRRGRPKAIAVSSTPKKSTKKVVRRSIRKKTRA